MSWFPGGGAAPSGQQDIQAELNGLKAYKINADSAIRKLRNKQKTLQERVREQERELNEKDKKLHSAARRIKTLQGDEGSKGTDNSKGSESSDSKNKEMMMNDVRHLVDENLKLKKRIVDIQEEYQIRNRSLETNLEVLTSENRNLKAAAEAAAKAEPGNEKSEPAEQIRNAAEKQVGFKAKLDEHKSAEDIAGIHHAAESQPKTEKLTKTESTNYRIRLAQTQDKLLQLRNAYGALQVQVTELKRCLQEKDGIIESMVSQESVDDKFKALQEKTSRISESFARTQSELIEKTNELESKQKELGMLQGKHAKLRESTEAAHASQNDVVIDLRTKVSDFKAKNESLSLEVDKLRNELKTIQTVKTEQEEALKTSKSKVSNLELRWEDEMKTRIRFEKISKELKIELQESGKSVAEKENIIKNQDEQIKDLLMKQKIEQKKNSQLTRDLKKALRKDAVKATETKAELALEVDKCQALEAQLKRANAKVKHMQKRLLIQSSLGHNADSKDLSAQARTILNGMTRILETSVRRLLEYKNSQDGSVDEIMPPLPPPPVPTGPKPNTPQAEFVEAIASRYEATMQREHVYQERMKYLQETVRLLQDDCEKKKIIIQNFMLDTARDTGSDFKSKFNATPEEFRELLLQKLEVVLQDAIVQNIRLRDQLANLMRKNADMRIQDKKLRQTIVACRHVILKLRAAVSITSKDHGEDSKDSEPGILDAADALDVSAPDEASRKKEAMAQIELLDASLADAQEVTEKKSALDFPVTLASQQPVGAPTIDTTVHETTSGSIPTHESYASDEEVVTVVPREETAEPVAIEEKHEDPPVAELPVLAQNDDGNDGPEVLEIPT